MISENEQKEFNILSNEELAEISFETFRLWVDHQPNIPAFPEWNSLKGSRSLEAVKDNWLYLQEVVLKKLMNKGL